jgi:hypothetical protein
MLYLLVRRIWGNILTVGGLEEVDEIPWCHVRACVLCVSCRKLLRHNVYEFVVEQDFLKSRDSSVGIALGYGLDDRGSIPGGCWEFFSKPPRPERL